MTRFGICLAVTLLSALVSLGFSIAAVTNNTGQARTSALYATARSLSFVIIGCVPALNGSGAWLQAVAAGMIIVQACDAAIGVVLRDRLKSFGPAGTAVLNLAALLWLMA